MSWFKKASFLILPLTLWAAAPSTAEGRPVRQRQRIIVVQPRYYPYRYSYNWYGPQVFYGPGRYVPWGGQVLVTRPNLGKVKISTHLKDALLYVDGGYAGVTGKLKEFQLQPGNHDIEVRDLSGRALFHERVQVIVGRTVEIKP